MGWRRNVRRSLGGLLRLEPVNRLVLRLRFHYYVRVRRRLRVHGDERAVIMHEYSQRQLMQRSGEERPLRLIRPLASIEYVNKNGHVLSIGCRFEAELLYLVGYGFRADRVRGLDMISYSPWIDAGNMHALPYEDDRWDVIVMGWVLSYSDDPRAAAREAIRVARNGAVIAIGVSHYPDAELLAWRAAQPTPANDPRQRLQTVDALLEIFGDRVDRVFFSHDPPRDAKGSCMVIFSVRK
jgi:SAM-dependent methyltransferase